MAAVVGFLALALIAAAESAANHGAEFGGPEWRLGKAETLSWQIAVAAFVGFGLTPLPSPVWGFVRAASPLAILWIVNDQAAQVSESLHHAEPIWLEWAVFALLYIGLVPWTSWRLLTRTGGRTATAAKAD